MSKYFALIVLLCLAWVMSIVVVMAGMAGRVGTSSQSETIRGEVQDALSVWQNEENAVSLAEEELWKTTGADFRSESSSRMELFQRRIDNNQSLVRGLLKGPSADQ